MQDLVLKISTILNIPPVDVYFLVLILVIFGIFLALGMTKIYEVLFGLVLGIAIFIVFQYLLLNPNLSVPAFISTKIAKFIVGSSIYLIFILSILVPLNGSLHIAEPKQKWLKYLIIFMLSILLTVFYVGVIIGFLEKTYIYKIENAFGFIKNLSFWNAFAVQSKIYKVILENVPNITLFGVLFVIYRVTFGDLVNILLKGAFDTLKKMGKAGGGGGGGGKGSGGGGGGGGDHGHH